MAKWKKKGIFLEPLFKFKCLGCKDTATTFYEFGWALQNFPIENDKDYKSHAIDREFRCNFCGWQLVFGIALSKEHFEEIKSGKNEHDIFRKIEKVG